MQDYMYSVIAFVAMTIHLIINYDLITARKVSTAEGMRYRCFLFWTLAFYLTDGGWGIFAGLLKHTGLQRWLIVLYVDTGICFIALALSVLMWCRFVITYLDFSKWPARVLAWSGYALFAFNLAALAVNIFNNSFFYFDVDGRYISGPMRKLAFYLLAAFNVLTAFCVLVKAFRNRGSVRRRSMMVFLFCFTMTAAIVIQILWPLLPLYALGSLIGGCFLHVFVIEGERNELRRAVIEREQTAKHMAELENALERARAAEKARSMFFSIVSHDIRTPLNAILGYSELLESGVRSPTERSEALKSIRASGTTLLQLVNDVLDLAKMDAGKLTLRPEPVHLAKLTDEVFASFRLAASGKGIELVNRTASAPTIMLDEHRFRQILFNLVGNAVKFTAKGSVTVSASYSGTVSASHSSTAIEVAVSDTGCGIPPEMLTHILDPFVQVQDPSHSADRAGGTGLGLPICKSLVEAMGGELFVESEVGKGSTFRARIPNVAITATRKGAPAGSAPEAASKELPKHVLVVDDSPVNRAVLSAFLKRAGITAVDHAGDGFEALAKLDAAAQQGEPHDFILSDLWMPNLNGLEFIEKLRADSRFATLPVYAVTADTEFKQDARTELFAGILLKPLTYAKLMEVFAAMDRA